MASAPDVVVVGAGAAGIAAARRLAEAGRSVLLVEALPRLGGRARTARIAGLPLDLGCGWLHSAERNPLAALAAAEGLEVVREPGGLGRAAATGSAPAEAIRARRLGRLRGLRRAAPPRSAGERPRRRRDARRTTRGGPSSTRSAAS